MNHELREAVRSMLAEQSPPERVLARCEDGEPYDAKLWRILAVEMGLAGLAVPEQYGGAGAGWPAVAVVVEELGRSVAPVPYLGSAVVATTTLLTVGDAELLAGLAGGTVTAALAVPFDTAPGSARPPGVSVEDDRLTGEVSGMADALAADVLLVPTAAGLYEVPATADGVERRPVVSLDLTRPLCDLVLDSAPGRLLAAGPAGARAVDAALAAGAALLASEQLGIAAWCLESTVDHVTSRYQFARPVGSFQAVKHRLADLWVALAQARAVAEHAAASVAAGEEAAVAAALAQAFCGPAAVRAAQECVQLHGGIGFTWEHPAHLYLKRATSAAVGFGTADRHRAALAALVNLPPPGTAPRSR